MTNGYTAARLSASLLAVLVLASSPDHEAVGQTEVLRSTRMTNGAGVRRVFSEVVQDANQWTVRVLCDGRPAAFGVIVQSNGRILTKASQLDGDITCKLADGRVLPVTYVGHHPEHDLALLKVDAEDLPTVRWQGEGDPAVGGWVITPDQEGSPRAVGVLSVPRRAIPQVKIRGVLGISMSDEEGPPKIDRVMPGSAAEVAKLQPDDIIHKVDDVPVRSRAALVNEIGRHAPGDRLTLLVERGGKRLSIPATLMHPFGDFLSRIAMQNQMGGELSNRRSGFPSAFQHDTVLDPEECGGPLVDLTGAAVGINIARAGRTESYAIPDDIVRGLVGDLIAGRYPPPEPDQPMTVVTTTARKVDSEAEQPETPPASRAADSSDQ